MKNLSFLLVLALVTLGTTTFAQKKLVVPEAVKSALAKKYPEAKKVTWEAEKGNFEANWGGKSGEDNSVMFTPAGEFLEIVKAIPVTDLPKPALEYITKNYPHVKIAEAGRVTDAKGVLTYEAEVQRKDIIFDANGNFIRKEK